MTLKQRMLSLEKLLARPLPRGCRARPRPGEPYRPTQADLSLLSAEFRIRLLAAVRAHKADHGSTNAADRHTFSWADLFPYLENADRMILVSWWHTIRENCQ